MTVAAKVGSPSKSSADPFETWLSERHKWLQTAANRLIQTRRMPKGVDFTNLVDLCIAEAKKDAAASFESVTPGTLATAVPKTAFKICRLSDVKGVNAIKTGASLDFGKPSLVTVYGPNGSGKTGYSRLLKDACGSRARDELRGNVFEDAGAPATANITISADGKEAGLAWKAGEALPQLRDVHVFDSRTATIYMVDSNEASYEPMRMRFVSSLIRICDAVSQDIELRKGALVKKLPLLPDKFATTKAGTWLIGLTDKTNSAAIGLACTFSAEQDSERIAGEGALAQQDITKRLAEITKEKATLNLVESTLRPIRAAFDTAALSHLIVSRSTAHTKRKAATDDAKAVFANAPLAGVGQATWMALWEAARTFSEEHAYHGIPFPNVADTSRCVLCEQELDAPSKGRMTQFEAFVKSNLEANAKAAEDAVAKLTKALPTIPAQDEWKIQLAALKIDDEKTEALRIALTNERITALTASDSAVLQKLDWSSVDDALGAARTRFDQEEKNLKALQQDGERKKLESRVLELQAHQWLSQQQPSIEAEVQRLSSVAVLDKAAALCSTNLLTRKNTELAKQELDTGYQERFAAELEKLGGKRLPIKPLSKQQGKGKTTFTIALHGAKSPVAAEKILSEGELRIVALAAFLADIAGSGQPTPFIFDDPISSLDQDFEERVVARLIDLARTRQVIVFTHRLSLVTLLGDEIKKIKAQADLEKVMPAVELHVETLRRLGKLSGLTTKFSVRDAKPKTALNRLVNEMLPTLRKLHDAGEVEDYEQDVKGVCSDFRIIMERSVESVLLNDVLVRFRRSLQTMGRIGSLAKINATDCAFIDDLMTRYSAFEHSQSDEFAAAIPELDILEADVKALAAWVDEFDKRAVS